MSERTDKLKEVLANAGVTFGFMAYAVQAIHELFPPAVPMHEYNAMGAALAAAQSRCATDRELEKARATIDSSTIETLESALATERAAREKVEQERDEARRLEKQARADHTFVMEQRDAFEKRAVAAEKSAEVMRKAGKKLLDYLNTAERSTVAQLRKMIAALDGAQ